MTDRELLELAAKAAGYRWQDWTPCIFSGEGELREWPYQWNPLLDGGDALRLAVKLAAKLQTLNECDGDGAVVFELITYAHAFEPSSPDPYAATRRAIVRAAAEIGRNMARGQG
jgi:hypothetical protein